MNENFRNSSLFDAIIAYGIKISILRHLKIGYSNFKTHLFQFAVFGSKSKLVEKWKKIEFVLQNLNDEIINTNVLQNIQFNPFIEFVV